MWSTHRPSSIQESIRYVVPYTSAQRSHAHVNKNAGRLIPIPWHIVARQYNVSVNTNAFSPIHVATSASLLGFLGTSGLSYAICRNEIATQQAQLKVLRELEQKAAELQAEKKAKEGT